MMKVEAQIGAVFYYEKGFSINNRSLIQFLNLNKAETHGVHSYFI
tara:strand:- start:1035 stop:1169 length:135 start_codon:yes stop_codon:yes gene_type:complete